MTEVRDAPGAPPTDVAPTADLHRALMEDMLVARRASERLWNLQRQGRIATIPPLTGQEAAIVGVVRALNLAHDWLVPYYREQLGMAALGDEFLEQVVMYWRGHPDGGRVPDGVLCLPPQISLGSQVPHAAGLAWGLKLRGEPGIVCTFIGDGATSEGDFAEGLNLAGVQRVPLLVVVLNNGWAISTPTTRQTAAPTFAAKAGAAGVPSARVDGNDMLAVLDAARRRAPASRPATGRCSSRSSPTASLRTRTPTTPRGTSRRKNSRRGKRRPHRPLPGSSHRRPSVGRRRARRARRGGGSPAGADRRRCVRAHGRPRVGVRPSQRQRRGAVCAGSVTNSRRGSRARRRPRRTESRGGREHGDGDPRHDRRRDGARRPRHPPR